MKTILTARFLFALSLLTFLIALPSAAQPKDSPDAIIPKIVINDVPVWDVVKNLSRQAELNCILDPRVAYDPNIPPVTITLEKMTAKDALDKILKIRRLVRIENPATTVSRIVPEKLAIKPIAPEWLKNDTNAVIPVIVMEDVPLRDALVNLAHQIGWTINFDQKLTTNPSILSAPVSLRWNKLTGKQALIALLDNYDLTIADESSTGVVTIAKKSASQKSP